MRAALPLAAGLALAACGGGSFVTIPEVDPTTTFNITQHYRQFASERNGRCNFPRIDGILASEVVERSGDTLTLDVRYRYLDEFFEGEDTVTPIDDCRGFAERRFTLSRAEDGESYTVTAMSPPNDDTVAFF